MMNEYLRRNIIVAKAYGVTSGIESAIKRLRATKRPPRWLLELLHGSAVNAASVRDEMVAHRDETTVGMDARIAREFPDGIRSEVIG